MEQIKIPDGYQSSLNLHDTQIAIKTVKDFFQQTLAQKLNLLRVSAPVFVNPSSGLNDNLNGVERPVSFDIKGQPENAEIVHSLAKWKRYALQKYGFAHGEGLYTDMIAIRRDEDLDEDEIAEYITEHFEGNSLIAAGDEDLIKIHFHTNEPWKILEYCNTIGEIYDIVVEDMIRQANGQQG